MAITITKTDFAAIGQLATHCDNEKLQIAVKHAIDFDLQGLLGDLWYEVEENWTSTEAKWRDLIDGSSYTNCKDRTRRHAGLKEALLYYSYAQYVITNGFSDSPNGIVNKQNQFSVPKPFNELKAFSDKYRNMGYSTLKKAKDYLCVKQELYPSFYAKDCAACGCGEEHTEGTAGKTFSVKGKNISKH